MFFVLNIGNVEEEPGGDTIFAGLLWMGFFFAFVPSMVRNDVKAAWYSKKYIYGSILLFLLNVFVPLFSGYIYFNFLQ